MLDFRSCFGELTPTHADDGKITSARRFHAFVGVVMGVPSPFALMLARALRWEGRLGPIAGALRQPPAA